MCVFVKMYLLVLTYLWYMYRTLYYVCTTIELIYYSCYAYHYLLNHVHLSCDKIRIPSKLCLEFLVPSIEHVLRNN